MKKLLYFIVAAATVLAGCSKESVTEMQDTIVIPSNSFLASFVMNGPAKTTITPGLLQYSIYWQNGDIIKVTKNSEPTAYSFSVSSMLEGGTRAVFTAVDALPSDFFDKTSTYSASFGDGTATEFSVENGSAAHICMAATTVPGNFELQFEAVNDKAILAVSMPVSAKSLIVKEGSTVVAKLKSKSNAAISTFYVPVPSATKRYEIYAYSDDNYTDEIAESMKMYSAQSMSAQSIYPFTFTPTLKITSAGTHSLKSYAGDYKVWICNDAQSSSVSISELLTIQYASGAASHPANVYVDGKESTVTNLAVNTPDSHVEISNGTSVNVTSQTSKGTFVVKPTYSITTALTAHAGSVTVEGKENGEKNVKEIVLDYGSQKSDMSGVVISVSKVTSGDPVKITNNTTSTGETPITVVGKDNSEQAGATDGGFKVENGKQNITITDKASAKIGESVYKTLADAVAAVVPGTPTTIVMIDDEEMTSVNGPTIANNMNVTIDLAGHFIDAKLTNGTSDACAVVNISNGGKLTMKDSGNNGKIILTSATVGDWPQPNIATNVFTNQGDLTIEGGYYENKGQGHCSYVVDNNSNTGNVSLTVHGGYLFAQYCPLRTFLNNSATTNKVNITNGIFEGRYIAFFQQNGTASSPLACTISGGTFIDRTTYSQAVHMFYFDVLDAGKLDFEITGGTYSTTNSEKYFVYPDVIYATPNCDIKVSGGSYSNNNIASSPAIIPSNFEVSGPGSDGYYTVQPIGGNVAKVINGSQEQVFKTLPEAFAATQQNGTIELIADVDLKNTEWTPVVFAYKTFDGKGHIIKNLKVTGNGKMVGFIGNGDCSIIRNLTIDGANVTGINHVGIIAGRGMCTKIENCHVKNASVSSNVYNNDDGDKVAAICGYLSGEWHAWVRNCSVENCTVTGYRDLGSIVGYAEAYDPKDSNVGIADISGNSATNVQVLCNTSNNYKNYTTNEQCHAGQILGEKSKNATLSNNSVENVTVTYSPSLN